MKALHSQKGEKVADHNLFYRQISSFARKKKKKEQKEEKSIEKSRSIDADCCCVIFEMPILHLDGDVTDSWCGVAQMAVTTSSEKSHHRKDYLVRSHDPSIKQLTIFPFGRGIL